nr:hypothetical protein [Tanacetum cinerariifolium]
MDACVALTRRVEHLEYDKVAQALEITKLKRRVKKLEKRNKVRVLKLRRMQKVRTSQRVETSDDTVMDDESNQGKMIAEMDQDDAVVLEDDKEEDKDVVDAVKDVEKAKEDETDPVEVQEVVDVVTTIKHDDQYARELHAELIKDIDWDEAIDHIKRKAKEDPTVKKYQAMKRKPQTKAQARKNMMMYLKNIVGFKLDYFKGMSYDDIRLIFEAKFNSNVDFLLKTKEQMEEDENRALAMFEKPDAHAQIWKNQRTVHGQEKVKSWKLLESCGVQIITFTTTRLILLVERRYPLSRFTLDQMLNAVRLQVEEESEVSWSC